MVDPYSPVNTNAQGPQDSNKTGNQTSKTAKNKFHFGGRAGTTHHYLKMDFNQEEWDKLWQSTIQMINAQIQKNAEKSNKAMKRIANPDEED